MKRSLCALTLVVMLIGAWETQALTTIPGAKALIKLGTAFKPGITLKFENAMQNGPKTWVCDLNAAVYVYKGNTINSGLVFQSGPLKGGRFTLQPNQIYYAFPFQTKIPALAKGTYLWRIQPLVSKIVGNTYYPVHINDLQGTYTVR